MTRAEAWVRFAAGAVAAGNLSACEIADAMLQTFDRRFVRVDNEWKEKEKA